MNLTIPIRATNSNSSLTRDMGGYSSVRHSSTNVWKNTKSDQKRFVLSIVTVGLLVSTLAVGSIGGVMQSASARENTWYGQGSQNNSRNNNNYSNTNRNDTHSNNPNTSGPTTGRPSTQTPVTTTPPTTTPTKVAPPAATPQPAATPVAAPTAAAPTQVVTPQVVSQPAIAETPAPVDTAPAIANMATAQTHTSSEAVTYTSERMSEETRNRLMILAGVAAVTGGLLYTMSFIGTAPATQKRGIPIRYIVPVREAASY